MHIEKVAKQMKHSLNSTSSIFLLLSSLSSIAKEKKKEGGAPFDSTLYSFQEVFLGLDSFNPSTKNILNYVTKGGTSGNVGPERVLKKVSFIKKYVADAEKKMAALGEKKLKEGGAVFVFGHDSPLSGILKLARSNGKKFGVHNTEMRPNFYGRKLAGDLTKGGISIHHYADSSLKQAISCADVVFCDCISILSTGDVLGTAGFELVVDVALKEGVPLYVCAPSWKVDFSTFLGHNPKNYLNLLWDGAPKGVKLNSPMFDIVNSKSITGVISELGIYPSDYFIDEVKHENIWGTK